MDTDFWHERWEKTEIGFHQGKSNPMLVKHFQALSLAKNARVFVPLCGKTLDISWLLSNGYRVAGAELSTIAIDELFQGLGVEPAISEIGKFKHYSAENIDIFVGDIFELSGDIIGSVDAVYDRAALVALPKEMRNQYAAHMIELTRKSPQLLLSFEYDQTLMDGPPFSVSNEEVNHLYGDSFDLTLVSSTDVPGGLRGKFQANEAVWLLR